MKTYTCGERNAEGRRFWAYEKTPSGTFKEIWMSPERWERQRACRDRCRDRWRALHETRVHAPKADDPNRAKCGRGKAIVSSSSTMKVTCQKCITGYIGKIKML